MSAYFITSCGTNIGKTFATCALMHAARAKGMSIAAYKPIISGFNADHPQVSDTGEILQALHENPLDMMAIEAISPWRFAAPLSPHMAAAMEGKPIIFDALVEWSKVCIGTDSFTLIEGVGGVMVPLDDTHTVRDWMAALAVPAILVTGSYLGSISHTLSAIETLNAKNIPIHALIVSESADAGVPLTETLATYDRFASQIPLRIAQARVSSPEQATAIHALIGHLR